MKLDNPLWRYALRVYAQPEIAALCLKAQEQGASVNRLLLAAWLAAQGRTLPACPEPSALLQWSATILQPLRELRYRLREKKQAQQQPLYARLKQCELDAEQVELAYLWQWVEAVQTPERVRVDRDGLCQQLHHAAQLATDQPQPDWLLALATHLMAAGLESNELTG